MPQATEELPQEMFNVEDDERDRSVVFHSQYVFKITGSNRFGPGQGRFAKQLFPTSVGCTDLDLLP